MRQCQSCDDGFVHELEADNGNQGDRELVLVSSRGALDYVVDALRGDAGDEGEDDCEESEGLRDWEGEIADLRVCVARDSCQQEE